LYALLPEKETRAPPPKKKEKKKKNISPNIIINRVLKIPDRLFQVDELLISFYCEGKIKSTMKDGVAPTFLPIIRNV
jgi:hypothetical protein